MDKLYKVGQWAWQNKERMVLIVLVLVLGYQVVQVVNSKPPTFPVMVVHLKETAPETTEVPVPPTPPVIQPAKDSSPLHVRNPFWVYSSTGEKKDSAPDAGPAADPGIHLLDIQKLPGGGYSARIKTQGTKYYKEGEPFESYKLNRIDAENRQVEVYSEKLGKTLTLSIE